MLHTCDHHACMYACTYVNTCMFLSIEVVYINKAIAIVVVVNVCMHTCAGTYSIIIKLIWEHAV